MSTTTKRTAAVAVGAVGAGLLAGRALRSEQVRFARMSGTSIAAPDAAGWVTDFLNAAYYAREPRAARRRRPAARVRDRHDALAPARRPPPARRPTCSPSTAPSAAAAARQRSERARHAGPRAAADAGRALLGDWFPDGVGRRRAPRLGDRLRDGGARRRVRARAPPARRASSARSRRPSSPTAEQVWHTYAPVEVPAPTRHRAR